MGTATTVKSLSLFSYDSNSTAETVYLALYSAATNNLVVSGSFTLNSTQSGGTGIAETVSVTPTALAAGTYYITVCVPTGTSHFSVGPSNSNASFDFGSYAGGAPPASYTTLNAGSNLGAGTLSFETVTAESLAIQTCP